MSRKFRKDISASTTQMALNYSAGIIVFYILSTTLSKPVFGELNWTLALTLVAFNILACGIDNVSIRKIAAGEDRQKLVSTYTWHVLLSGSFFYLVLLVLYWLVPSFFEIHWMLPLLGLARMLIFFSYPYKHLAAGLAAFRLVMWMSLASNLVRCASLLLLVVLRQVTIEAVIIIFIASAALEWIISFTLARRYYQVTILPYRKKEHFSLVKDSLPQLGVVIFDSVIARFDWIFLGVLGSTVILAEYSFAYKVFEASTLPLFIIGPVLIPRSTKLFSNPVASIDKQKLENVFHLLRMEMVISCLIALLLNLAWTPLIDPLTYGRYGSVNENTVLLLSFSMPFLYLNNLIWTIHFGKGNLKLVLVIITISFFVNVAGDLLLIPAFKAEGAAIAYSFAIMVQSLAYLRVTRIAGLSKALLALPVCMAAAAIAGMASLYMFDNTWLIIAFSVVIYVMLLLAGRQIRFRDNRLAFFKQDK